MESSRVSRIGHPLPFDHWASWLRYQSGRWEIRNRQYTRTIAHAKSAGVDWIEIDIRLCGGPEPRLVVFHDERIDAKTNRKGAVAELSVEKLKDATLRVSSQESILTLDEVFAEFHDAKTRWILDVKANGMHNQVLRWLDNKIENGQLTKQQVIIFGTYEILDSYQGAGYSLGCTVTWGEAWNRTKILLAPSRIIQRCQEIGCKTLVLPMIFSSQSLVEAAKTSGLEVWVYGVKHKRDFQFLTHCGVSGFIVDVPENFTLASEERANP